MTTASTLVDQVIRSLTGAGYRKLEGALAVASVNFEFAAVVVGTGRSSDLIVVVDTIADSEKDIEFRVQALSRALDIVGSRRPLTAVLVGPKPTTPTIERIARVSRVLLVERRPDSLTDAYVGEQLAVLLPLRLRNVAGNVADATSALQNELADVGDRRIAKILLSAATKGSDSAEEALKRILEEPFTRLRSHEDHL